MDSKIVRSFSDSIAVKQATVGQCYQSIEQAGILLAERAKQGNLLMFCGNGGSAADAQHLAAELVVRLRGAVNRPALPAISLSADSSILTAGGNDFGYEQVFARSVEAFGKSGDCLIAITTSGNSLNVLRAVQVAKERGVHVVGLLGSGGGAIAPLCDIAVIVPSAVTARVQETHILIGHIWCEMIEEICFPEHCAGKV
jgi:D-sedoheptulose 7-phosphate isomerase